MIALGIIVPVAILAALVIAAVLFIQRGAAGVESSPRSLLRVYLYLGSLVSILVLVVGLSMTLTGVFGAIAPDFTYGVSVGPEPMPPGTPNGMPIPPPRPSVDQQHERETRESLLQGITSAVAGAIFWAVHWYGRRRLETPDERTSLLRRGYFILGVAIFGVASIVLLPMAVYNALRWLLIPVTQFEYRPGAGDSLAAALVVVPVWLLYLRFVLVDYRVSRPPTGPMPAVPAT